MLRRCFALLLAFVAMIDWQAVRAQEPPATPLVITTPSTTMILPTVTPTSLSPAAPPDQELRRYTVQTGDTLISVAIEIGVNLDEMGCLLAPDFRLDQPLVIGDTLEALPPNIRCYQTTANDSIAAIAKLFGVTGSQILNEPWNRFDLNQSTLQPLPAARYVRVPISAACSEGACISAPGLASRPSASMSLPAMTSFLPWMLDQPINTSPYTALARGGPAPARTMPLVPADWPYGSGHFTWPLYGWLTQGYRYDHRAIDIAAPVGTPVTASDRGVVKRAGWNNQGYGLFVVIDHNIDYITLYAHLSQVMVNEGDVVAQGQVVGLVGSTGNSTGPHLHYELRDFGRLTNPLELLGR